MCAASNDLHSLSDQMVQQTSGIAGGHGNFLTNTLGLGGGGHHQNTDAMARQVVGGADGGLINQALHIGGTAALAQQMMAFAKGDSIVQKPFKGEGIIPGGSPAAGDGGAGSSYAATSAALKAESQRQESAAKAEADRVASYNNDKGISVFGRS